ncbi:hypothetical protein ACFIQF_11525 [Comamonas sp. J-3]|uniref:hypothetical protein n=1 Tax=Comamonas trifloxystrobinivorans TaxID=3350256 RepID=UPI00372BEEEB
MTSSTANTTRRGSRAPVISPLLQRALDAGRRVCEDMQDSPEARQAMKREILEIARTDERLLPGLIAGLTYPRLRRADLSPTANQQTKE